MFAEAFAALAHCEALTHIKVHSTVGAGENGLFGEFLGHPVVRPVIDVQRTEDLLHIVQLLYGQLTRRVKPST